MISIKTKYACAVVLELACLQEHQRLSIGQLAQTCAVPKKYLEQLLNSLRKDGIVKSIRGKDGGYQLAKNAAHITINDIARNLETKLSFSDSYVGGPVLKGFWTSVDKTLETRFNGSIGDLAQEKMQQESVLNYCI